MTTQELVEWLRGTYRIPITDGLGPAGGEEPGNADFFVRTFPTSPLATEAAERLSEMDAENKRLRAFVQRVSEIPSPRKRPEDDIDALYQNEEHFAAVIDAARAALEQQQQQQQQKEDAK